MLQPGDMCSVSLNLMVLDVFGSCAWQRSTLPLIGLSQSQEDVAFHVVVQRLATEGQVSADEMKAQKWVREFETNALKTGLGH